MFALVLNDYVHINVYLGIIDTNIQEVINSVLLLVFVVKQPQVISVPKQSFKVRLSM